MSQRAVRQFIGIAWIALLVVQPGRAAEIGTWVEGSPDALGATRDRFNYAAGLAWKNQMGDWVDRQGESQGTAPWAEGIYQQNSDTIDLDVTELYAEYLAHSTVNHGFFLRTATPSAPLFLYSREAEDPVQRPRLVLRYKNGAVEDYAPSGDVSIYSSSFKSNGADSVIQLQPGSASILMRFPVDPNRTYPALESARLRLTIAKSYGKKSGAVELYQPAAGQNVPLSAPIPGLAKNYDGDRGIAANPGVYFATDFSGDDWEGVIGELPGSARVVNTRAHGPALRVTVPGGQTLGLNEEISFSKLKKAEPTHVFFRYYIRFSDDWRPAEGGKLPGISGTYGRAGWGGRQVDGKNGWSARGGFRRSIYATDGNLRVPMTSYVYYPDSNSHPYGKHFGWEIAQRGILKTGHWYCVEQELKLNTPGKKNGYLNVWIDGRPALRESGLRFRDIDDLRIEKVWLNVYHGGMTPAPADLNMFIDNIVVADRYIGPAMLPYAAEDWWSRLE